MTTATETLRAYHGDPKLKAKVMRQVRTHRRLDQIIQGQYWDAEEKKGCAVGCLLHDPEGGHEQYEPEFGIPELLAHLEDGIFEALPVEVAKDWPVRFLNAIPVGADLSTVWPRYAIWLMTDPTWGMENTTDAEAWDARAAWDWAAWAAWDARDARDAWAGMRELRGMRWDAFVIASADKLVELLEAS